MYMGDKVTRLDDVRAQLDRESAAAELPPMDAYLQDEQGFADTDIANAVRMAKRHGNNIRYTAAGGWMVWDGRRWCQDEKDVRVQALAKNTALSIFDEIRKAKNRDEIMSHAKRSQSKRSIEAMLWLT
jgi:phage/plasmid-associated DNA primase